MPSLSAKPAAAFPASRARGSCGLAIFTCVGLWIAWANLVAQDAPTPAAARTFRFVKPQFTWEWTPADDTFRLADSQARTILSGRLQPAVLVEITATRERVCRPGKVRSVDSDDASLRVEYEGVNNVASLSLTLDFTEAGIWIGSPRYETPRAEDVVSLSYFGAGGPSPEPLLASSHFVVPGLCMNAGVSPVVSGLAGQTILASLGSAAWQGGLSQQWGLPAHFFAGFNATGAPNASGAFTRLLSDGYCLGLAELPSGDVRLEVRGGKARLEMGYRSDLWGQSRGPGTLTLGAPLLLTVARTWHEAVREYYHAMASQGIPGWQRPEKPSRRLETALLPQFNTWGAQVAMGKAWSRFDQPTLEAIYAQLRQSGLKPRMFVVDATWEGEYGTLEHSPTRFPGFEEFLDRVRADGYRIGLWAAFLRCENPEAHGLTLENVFRTADGTPIARYEGTKRYYLFDFTQPAVEAHLRARAAAFVRRYRPDLVKFDFGYELPALGLAAPWDRRYTGEKLLFRALDIVLGAMRAENPDLAVMYYGLSPFLAGHMDLHSPDDLWLNPGDYALEANRRFLFSSLLGELGIPTLGSTGYDWSSAPSIWFDAVMMGTLGSLQSFTGDELDERPSPVQLAKYNGLVHLIRPVAFFRIQPLDTRPHSTLHGANAASWVRLENGSPVMFGLRDRDWAGRATVTGHLGAASSGGSVVAGSLTELPLDTTPRLGLVPFGAGVLTLQRTHQSTRAVRVTHVFRGQSLTNQVHLVAGPLRLPFAERTEAGDAVEWIAVDVEP